MRKKFFVLILSYILIAINTQAQVGIGTETPDVSSILDIVSTDKGLLAPRVELTSITMDLDGDATTMQPAGLLVYNIGGTLLAGYYYWNGSEWKIIESSNAIPPSITDLLCDAAVLSPAMYYNGKAYTGIMKIPYTGGNGGRYLGGSTVTITDVNGGNLNFKLQEGKLEIGSGELVFIVTGTPAISSPIPTKVPINSTLVPFFTDNCEATVGDQSLADIKSVAVMANLSYSEDNGVKGYSAFITTPDGKFSIRAFILNKDVYSNAGTFGTDSPLGINLQIRNNTSSSLIIAGIFQYIYAGGSAGDGNNALKIRPGVWSGSIGGGINQQTISSPLLATELSDTGAPGFVQSNITTHVQGRVVSLGNDGVMAGGAPEYRLYSWMVNDGMDTKTSYLCTFSSSAKNPSSFANAESCPGGICDGTKVYFKLEQITAP